MSSVVEIQIALPSTGAGLFNSIDIAFKSVGLAPVIVPGHGPRPQCVVTDTDGECRDSEWPPSDEPRENTDSVELSFSIGGRANDGEGCEVTVYFDPPRVVDILEVSSSVPQFAIEYGETWRDMATRIITMIEALHKRVPIESAESSIEGETWLSFNSGSWSVVPDLPGESIGDWSLEGLRKWAADETALVGHRDGSFVINRPGDPDPIALLRSSPLDGRILERSSLDEEFEELRSEDEDGYRRICWSARGIEDLVERYGPPNAELRAFEPDWYKASDDEIIDRQIAYFDIDPRYVVLFRQYRNGRTTCTLAGKRRV